jgi:predicted phosphodiesterase
MAVAVQGQDVPFYNDSFGNTDVSEWTLVDDPEPRSGPSNWQIVNGELIQTSNIWSYDPPKEFQYHLGSHAVAGDSSWDDYTLNAILRSTDNDGIGLIFRYQDPGNYYRILLMNDPGNSGGLNSAIQRIQKFEDGEPTTLHQNVVGQAYPPGYFSLTADVRGNEISAYLNGEEIGRATDETFQEGRIGLMVYANSGARFDSVSVWQENIIYDEPEQPDLYPVVKDRDPYIQHPQEDQVQLAWRTVDKTRGTVLYGKEKGKYTQSVDSSPANKHRVFLKELDPDTRYFYTVLSNGQAILQDASFMTATDAADDTISFFVLGDSGTGKEAQVQIRDALIQNYNQNAADLLIHVGDVHQQAGDEYDSVYFDVYQPLIQQLGFFLAIGNHDTYTDAAGPFLDSFDAPGTNGHPEGRYYWHTWGNSFFLNIDTNLDVSKGSPQYDFMVEALSSEERQSTDWTFAYFHHPPYTEYWPAWEGDQRVRDHLVPLFEEFGVDMVFNGHTHSYEHGIIDNVHYLIAGGGGGNLDSFGRHVPHVRFSTDEHHFLRVTVDGLSLNMQAIDRNNEVFDTVEIQKEEAVSVDSGFEYPARIRLLPNYPNPFNPATNIRYEIPEPGRVKIEIYNTAGMRVAVPVDRFQSEGRYSVPFDAHSLGSGIYIVKITMGGLSDTRKITLLK